ncbi:BREX protein BrxB domain-containing protein, partial [Escherichia coli]|uniref:BREX protein BrxB domain-containing protein n=1 Tax=Escherichia coli TaxID=562 RepID=UPI003C07D7D0
MRKTLSGTLSHEKVESYIADKYKPSDLEFVLLSGLGSAWPLVRVHEFLRALQDVMGSTTLVLLYPGEYSGRDL